MKHFLQKILSCMIVCVGLYVGYTRHAMAMLGDASVLYVCAEYDDYLDYEKNNVFRDWVPMDVPYTIDNNVHENCTPPSGTTFAGWLVTGWDLSINGLYGEEIHQPGDVINLTDVDQFFIAQYEPAGATYTVTYSCNGGTGTAPSNETATENQSFTPASNTCTKNGYAFTGWAVSGTNDVKQAGTAFTWNYSENKTLTAQWTGNTVNLTWYNNNTLIQDTNNASNTCEYGDVLITPTTEPTRTGYDFAGWHVRPNYDFSTLPTNIKGTERCGIGTSVSTMKKVCLHGFNTVSTVDCSNPIFNDLELYEWKTNFNWGTIYGSSYCSAKSGNNSSNSWNNSPSNWKATYDELKNTSGEKQYCWCQATGYKPINNNTIYSQSSVYVHSFLVFSLDFSSAPSCSSSCTGYCASATHSYAGFRKAIFTLSN